MGFYRDWYEPDPADYNDEPAEQDEGSIRDKARAKAKKIASRRQFAIDQQSANQDDMFGAAGDSPERILDDVLRWRREDSTDDDLDNGDPLLDLFWSDYKDDIPF